MNDKPAADHNGNGNGNGNGDDAPPLPNLILMAERQRLLTRRMAAVEKKQKEMETMLNRFVGGTAILIGVGVFIGWLFTVGSGVVTFWPK